MKKLFFITILIIFSGTFLFSNNDSFFTPEISFGTGISIYDDNSDSGRKSLLNQNDFKRIVAGLTIDTNLNISEPIKIVFGAESFCDFLWADDAYFHTVDYALFSGIKIFPGIEGLNFSIAYSLGNRTDFFNTESEEDLSSSRKNITKSWGNGFRLAVQYDFMQQRNYKVKPHVGAYYRCVPRGNYHTDHILCINGGIRF